MASKSLSEILNGETRFGRLALISEADPTFNKRGSLVRHAMFRCDCGTVKRIQVMSVKSGVTKSCGCLKRENASVLAENTALRHGDARAGHRAPEYGIYRAMLSRCFNPKVERYLEYGGRGITVVGEWRGKGGYERFLAHVGRRPDADHSLDRIDPDGNYCPGNVRWAVKDVQANNKRNSVRFRVGDEVLTLKAMSERSGVGIATLRYRLKIGMTAEAAMCERIKTGPNASP